MCLFPPAGEDSEKALSQVMGGLPEQEKEKRQERKCACLGSARIPLRDICKHFSKKRGCRGGLRSLGSTEFCMKYFMIDGMVKRTRQLCWIWQRARLECVFFLTSHELFILNTFILGDFTFCYLGAREMKFVHLSLWRDWSIGYQFLFHTSYTAAFIFSYYFSLHDYHNTLR